jgi:hypothetical protein
MIGTFAFAEKPGADDIGVFLSQSLNGTRMGYLRFPEYLVAVLRAEGEYPARDIQTFETALAYALFWAIRLEFSLVICGDASAWNPDWGSLLGAPRLDQKDDREAALH